MGAAQIADIARHIADVQARGGDWGVTLEASGDNTRWLQFIAGSINAAYPFADAPEIGLRNFGAWALVTWEAQHYVTLDLELHETSAIAAWIDRYFVDLLGCTETYTLRATVEDFGAEG